VPGFYIGDRVDDLFTESLVDCPFGVCEVESGIVDTELRDEVTPDPFVVSK